MNTRPPNRPHDRRSSSTPTWVPPDPTDLDPTWIPPGVDTTRPAVARVYDYLLGGCHNFAADRQAAQQATTALPDLPAIARANRAFLWRAIRHLCGIGIDQFVDLGSGIPTRGNVHTIARSINPHTKVVYVDVDAVAVEHARFMLAGDLGAAAIQADLRQPHSILGHPNLTPVIDLTQPIGLLAVAVLHFIPDTDHPAAILHDYRQALAPGSYLAISHATEEHTTPADAPALHAAAQVYQQTRQPITFRTHEQLAHLLHDFQLVEPGIVPIPDWHPDPPTGPTTGIPVPGLAALAQIPPAQVSP